MPRADGTGPMGMGAMTGRGVGYCAGTNVRGQLNFVPGRGYGMGSVRCRGTWSRGIGGRGWRNMFYATGLPGWMRSGRDASLYGYPAPFQALDPNMEKQALRNQAEGLQSQLDAIRQRLNEMDTASSSK